MFCRDFRDSGRTLYYIGRHTVLFRCDAVMFGIHADDFIISNEI